MKTIVSLPISLIYVIHFFCLTGCTKSPTVLVEDDFKNGINGWAIIGDASRTTFETVLSS